MASAASGRTVQADSFKLLGGDNSGLLDSITLIRCSLRIEACKEACFFPEQGPARMSSVLAGHTCSSRPCQEPASHANERWRRACALTGEPFKCPRLPQLQEEHM